jgi:hypothetical protein
MLTYSILFVNILYCKNKLYINKLKYNLYIYIYIYIYESILIRAGSRALIGSSRVYTSLYRLIIELNFVFTTSSFNNRIEHKSNLFEPISSKLTSSSAHLHPYGLGRWVKNEEMEAKAIYIAD